MTLHARCYVTGIESRFRGRIPDSNRRATQRDLKCAMYMFPDLNVAWVVDDEDLKEKMPSTKYKSFGGGYRV